MKFYRGVILSIFVILALSFSGIAQADSFSGTIDIFKKSPAVQPFFKNAYGYAVFPTVGKGGIPSA